MAPEESLTLRPYRPSDRETLRRICCETADKGKPVERFFRDREIFADLLTRYYTDIDSHAVWVAESGRHVRGYLAGCMDTRRYWRLTCLRVIPSAILRAIPRGTFLQIETRRLLRKGLRTLLRGGFRRPVDLSRYPAHLHINLEEGLRGHHAGRLLMEKFLWQCRAEGVKGVHLVSRADNTASHGFFERMGFTRLGAEAGVPEGSRIYGQLL